MAIVYPKGNELTKLILDGFDKSSKPDIITLGNPMCIRFADTTFNIYLKCVSWKGKPYPENDTRAQLPSRPEFEAIKDSSDPFLFLGYDPICDVIVCWNPSMVKSRLNKSKYVSFYSKRNLQEEVRDGKFVTAHLSNGDKYVLFKRTDIASFLSMIDKHFPSTTDSTKEQCLYESEEDYGNHKPVSVVGILESVDKDSDVQKIVESMAQNHSTLQIIAECFNKFGNSYTNMKFQNWGSIISSYLENNGKKS